RRHMLRLILQDELLLLFVITSLVLQKVQLDGQSRKLATRGTEGVDGENVDLDQPAKSGEARSDAPPHYPLEGVRAGIVGHYPTYFEWSKTRDPELNHLALCPKGVTARSRTSPAMGLSPLSTVLTVQRRGERRAITTGEQARRLMARPLHLELER
ncbi:MAG TPA: hypothetical protein VFI76_00310, partial [Terrimicrobiaceae bacterium]|nr:hypothetical protein [Terrimicrobiaceae bacterium]